jgi:hypothetical protein
MKSRRLFHLIFLFLFLLPPLAEAGKCTGRLTLEQYEACQAVKAQNAPEERKSRAAVQDADRQYQAQREAARIAAQAEAEAEARANEARAMAAQQAAHQAEIQALIKETKAARRAADAAAAAAWSR